MLFLSRYTPNRNKIGSWSTGQHASMGLISLGKLGGVTMFHWQIRGMRFPQAISSSWDSDREFSDRTYW